MAIRFLTAAGLVGADRLAAVLAAALLGAFVFLAVGFVPIDAVHNAAHDARHVFTFPCH